MNYYPKVHLSIPGNREEFGIPHTPLGDVVCTFRLVWAKVDGEMQACILHPGLRYPRFSPLSAEEVYDEA